MIKIVIIILLVMSFFNPLQISWAFVIFAIILEGFLLLSTSRMSKYSFMNKINFNEEEQTTIKKYALFFRYPFTSRSLSTSLSLIALSAIILVPWFLYNHLWFQAIIIGFNFFLAQFISSRLNIRFYLHDAVERLKQEKYKDEMMLVDSICDKISKLN